MLSSRPIVIIEDDSDDQEIMREVLTELEPTATLLFFGDAESALHYLKTTSDNPFVILCDINLPIWNGLQLKMQIDKDPEVREKSIPFIFMSTAASKSAVTEIF